MKRTAVALARLVPLTVTVAPTAPAAGENEPTVGGRMTRKSAGLTDCPSAAVTTVMRPLVAAGGTIATTSPSAVEMMVVAATVPNFTPVTPPSDVPVIDTLAPGRPSAGEKPVMRGATWKMVPLGVVPAALVTLMGPVVAPGGTTARIEVADRIVGAPALTPLKKLTSVAAASSVPLIVTVAPMGAAVGEKLVIVGGRTTMRSGVAVTVPPALVTLMGPVRAVDGTVNTSPVSDDDATGATTEPIFTEAPASVVPVTVTLPPTTTLGGVNDAMVGVTLNAVVLETLRPMPTRVIGPVTAPAGTVVRSAVGGSRVKAETLTPLAKRTSWTAGKLVPVRVTVVPTGPIAGVNDVSDIRNAVRVDATRPLLLTLPSGIT